MTEYRLVVERPYGRNYYRKRDLDHALGGLEDALRDLRMAADVTGLPYTDYDAWIEYRKLSPWNRFVLDGSGL